jgi:hypothetical protein
MPLCEQSALQRSTVNSLDSQANSGGTHIRLELRHGPRSCDDHLCSGPHDDVSVHLNPVSCVPTRSTVSKVAGGIGVRTSRRR